MKRFLARWWWALYLSLLLASHASIARFAPSEGARDPAAAGREVARISVPGAPPTPIDLAYLRWSPAAPTDRPAVVLLHGSPGDATNFDAMGPLLARPEGDHPGYLTLTPDLPGFGSSTGWIPDYSISFHADALIAWLDAIGVGRAHLVGFSLGSGVILHIAERRPDLAASLTFLAGVGAEETEGSGEHWFEQAKYAVGYAALVVAPEMVPHFGLLGPRQARHAFLRNFYDTDQRPLRALMEANTTPALILHGRNDPLIAPWAAERHHELMASSRLLMLDDDHFMPFLRPARAVAALRPFLERHDDPDAPARTDAVYEIEPGPHPLGAWGEEVGRGLRLAPVWAALGGVGLLSMLAPRWGVVIAGLLVPGAFVDIGVASAGVLLGRGARGALLRRRRLLRGGLRALGTLALVAMLIAPLAYAGAREAPRPVSTLIVVLAPIVAYLLLAAGPTLLGALTGWRGRQRLKAAWRRQLHHEFWPTWLLYLPLVPYLFWLSLRYRNPLVFTAANPGVPAGGGLVGERKDVILRGLQSTEAGERCALAFALIEAGPSPEARAAQAARAVETDRALGGWPVIVKPNMGWRGASVRVCQDAGDLLRYFRAVERESIVQQYHAGPGEAGVFWIRDPGAVSDPARTPAGAIYAVTRKSFPVVMGDGTSTLEQLVLRHPRLRLQERAFRQRHAARWRETLPEDAFLRLVHAGNHYQGCLFTDGSDLVTPALEALIDEIARGYRDDHGRPIDFGRFDIRFPTEDDLMEGVGLGIVEFNGSTSEATNIYDPNRSTRWAYGVLFGQWRRLYALGAARRAAGVRPMGPLALVRMLVAYARRPRPPKDSD